MPVRSLSSSVLKWPDAKMVDQAVRRWAEKIAQQRQDVVRIGYFGSYARGDWGVGSDLDLVIVVERSDQPFERRATKWDMIELPVPTDVLIYTEGEWQSLGLKRRFPQTVLQETVWVYVKCTSPDKPNKPDQRYKRSKRY